MTHFIVDHNKYNIADTTTITIIYFIKYFILILINLLLVLW